VQVQVQQVQTHEVHWPFQWCRRMRFCQGNTAFAKGEVGMRAALGIRTAVEVSTGSGGSVGVALVGVGMSILPLLSLIALSTACLSTLYALSSVSHFFSLVSLSSTAESSPDHVGDCSRCTTECRYW